MGAINYKTSDYITLGVNVEDKYNYYDSEEYKKEFNIEYGKDPTNEDKEEAIQFDINFIYEEIEGIFNNYDFYYFQVAIEPGYYEGFSIDIENNFPLYYNDYEDKKAAQKEITELKKFLLAAAENGLVQVFPGWVTTYKTFEETIKAINTAIKELREEIKNRPTAKTYNFAS